MIGRNPLKVIRGILVVFFMIFLLGLIGGCDFISGIFSKKPVITTRQTEVYSGDKITVEFSNIKNPATQDWVSIYKLGILNEKYGEWYYLKGQENGTLTFTAPNEEGEYEFRLFLNWPQGGYKDVARSNTIRIVRSQQPSVSEGTLRLDKNTFLNGEEIRVYFTSPSTYDNSAWVGIIPSNVPHGNESVNDQYDLTYQYLNRQTSGVLSFKAPSATGSYDFRMHDTDNNGREVASVTFEVVTHSSSEAVSQQSSGVIPHQTGEGTHEIMVYIYSLNYKGMVRLNDENLYEIKGEKDMNYNYTGGAKLREGKNIFDVEYTSLPDPWKIEFKMKVYKYDWNSGKEEVIKEWVINDKSGRKSFELVVNR